MARSSGVMLSILFIELFLLVRFYNYYSTVFIVLLVSFFDVYTLYWALFCFIQRKVIFCKDFI